MATAAYFDNRGVVPNVFPPCQSASHAAASRNNQCARKESRIADFAAKMRMMPRRVSVKKAESIHHCGGG